MISVWVCIFGFLMVSCQSMIENQVINGLNRQHTEWLNDGKLHVILVGSGGPFNNTERVSTSTAIIAGGEFLVFDAGEGSARSADLNDLPLGQLSAVFLTHFHSDHIADLGELNFASWVNGRTKNLDVYGPIGVDKVVKGFAQVYEEDTKYRVLHHGKDIMNPNSSLMVAKPFSTPDVKVAALIFDRNGLKVWAFTVDHFPVEPAVGYRIEYKGNIVVLTGDTKKIETLSFHAKGADILVSEALSFKLVSRIEKVARENQRPRIAKIMKDIPDYHMTPVQAAEVAQKAGAKKLVFNHIAPPITNFMAKRIFLDGVDDVFDGDVELGKDGMTFVLDPKP